MANTPLIAGTTPTAQPNRDTTAKSQKAFQLGPTYDAQAINAEFDRIHKRINQVIVEDAHLANLSPSGATLGDAVADNASIMTQLNALLSTLEKANLRL